MYLEIFLADFAVFPVFLGISRDFAETSEFRGSATARNIRSPDNIFLVRVCRNFEIHEGSFTSTLQLHFTSFPVPACPPTNRL